MRDKNTDEQRPVRSEKRTELRTLDMYFNDPLDPNMGLANQLISMDDYQTLQLDKSFFDNFDQKRFKQHMKKLHLSYHPDKHPTNSDKATIVFQAVTAAAKSLLPATDEHQSANFTADTDWWNEDWWNEYITSQLNKLDEIQIRAEALSESGPGALVIPGDTYEKVSSELFAIWRETMVHEDAIPKQLTAIRALESAAKTGDDFYNLSRVESKLMLTNPGYSPGHCYQKGARLKHPLCMRALAGCVFSGLFLPY